MLARVHLQISGKVQGVFYRREAQRQARVLDLLGWVRNTENGGVEIIAEGEKRILQEFLKWCKQGSSFAQVQDVIVDWETARGEFKKFEIRF